MGVATKDMKLPIQKLLSAGALRSEGVKRGTQYFAGGDDRRTGRNGKSRAE